MPLKAWTRASELAAQTPPSRNRYVDFLRAASILVVVLGHWLVAAPYVDSQGASLGHLLDEAPWTRWLTWVVQVMPTFFLVGGFANATSWQSARAKGASYAEWLDGRTRRLIEPMLPLLLVWIALAAAARLAGVAPTIVRLGSQVALVPTWFLAVYLGVLTLVPASHAAWRRWGFVSFAAPAAATVAVDIAAFTLGASWLRWVNYACVWVAVHQLGYAWQAGRLVGVRRAMAWAAGGLAGLAAALALGPYPISMVGVPGQELSNTLPPTFVLFAFAVVQVGLVVLCEGWVRRWLDGERRWAGVVLVNANIMTLYLWHSTALVLLIGALVELGGLGLRLPPASGAWWLARIPWVATLALLLWPFVALFGRFERPSVARPAPAWRLLFGAALLCVGIGALALEGIGADSPLGVRAVAVLPLAGAALALGPGRRRGSG